jgi:hypothetical protein
MMTSAQPALSRRNMGRHRDGEITPPCGVPRFVRRASVVCTGRPSMAARSGALAAFAGPGADQRPLELSETAQHGQHQAAVRHPAKGLTDRARSAALRRCLRGQACRPAGRSRRHRRRCGRSARCRAGGPRAPRIDRRNFALQSRHATPDLSPLATASGPVKRPCRARGLVHRRWSARCPRFPNRRFQPPRPRTT